MMLLSNHFLKCFLSSLLLFEITIGSAKPRAAWSRPIPDESLGSDRSQVIEQSPQSFEIDGGARRGTHLFHSFTDFDIEENSSVYFLNPDGVNTIFSRVTGNSSSEILGRLGVRGRADLFLMNPNGILFGQNASLDLQGSFVATTANGLQFGEQGFFSATNPNNPGLLTVNPSAFLFNSLPTSRITNNSIAPAGVNFLGANQFGLRVPDGETLLLIGGEIWMDQGRLNALSGQIGLTGLRGIGQINLTTTANGLQFSIPSNSLLANISLTNSAQVVTSGVTSGRVNINANELNLLNGSQVSHVTVGAGTGNNLIVDADRILLSGTGIARANQTFSSSGFFVFSQTSGNAGNTIINTRQLRLENGGQIIASTFGSGRGGDITITADTIELDGITNEGIRSAFSSEATGQGNAGNINLTTRQLTLQSGATISTGAFSGGRGGNITVNASESMSVVGTGTLLGQTIGSIVNVGTQGSGNAGTMTLNTGRLTLQAGGTLTTSTSGAGRSGQLNISTDSIELVGRAVNGQVWRGEISNLSTTTGNASDTNLLTRTLTIRDAGAISTSARGQASGGNLNIQARESVEVIGGLVSNRGFENSAILTGATDNGNAGTLTLNTPILTVRDRGQILASTAGTGRAGDINITANSVNLIGLLRSSATSGITSETTFAANGGRAGAVNLTVGTLNLTDAAVISTGSLGSGKGGDITIVADRVNLIEGSGLNASARFAGASGQISITAAQLQIRDGAQILTSTTGNGQAGNIRLMSDRILLSGVSSDRQSTSSIQSNTLGSNTTGNAGNITISTNRLRILEGGAIEASTNSQGRGGNLIIEAQDLVELDGINTLQDNQSISSFLSTGTGGVGQAGNIQIATDRLRLSNGGQIIASTASSGSGGNIRIEANTTNLTGQIGSQIPTAIRSNVSAINTTGNAGNIRIVGNRLRIRDQGLIATSTSGQGNGGSIGLRLNGDLVLRNRGAITSSVFSGATGDSGNINISTGSLTATDGSQIQAVVSRPVRDLQQQILPGGRGNGGSIQVVASEFVSLAGTESNGFPSGLLTLSERAANGSAGDITVRTPVFRVADGAIVVASTFNTGKAGDIVINANEFEATNGGQVVTSTRNRGQAGSITLNAGEVRLSGTDPNFQIRQERARRYANRPNQIDRRSDVIVNQGSASGIFASAEHNATADGGQIVINSDSLDLTNRATISAQSQGEGNAGNILVNTTTLDAVNSRIATSASRSSGGAIAVSGDRIQLQEDSDIRTDSNDTGGNITIAANSLIAFGDSDVIAAAQTRGGNIDFRDTLTFFEGYNATAQDADPATLEANARADINATGATAGTIRLLDTSFIQNSLSDLPFNAINTESLLANSCIARTNEGGTFLITGAEGLPNRPGGAVPSSFPLGKVRSLAVIPVPDPSPHQQLSRPWQMGDVIVEPQGAYQLPDGQVLISQECI